MTASPSASQSRSSHWSKRHCHWPCICLPGIQLTWCGWLAVSSPFDMLATGAANVGSDKVGFQQTFAYKGQLTNYMIYRIDTCLYLLNTSSHLFNPRYKITTEACEKGVISAIASHPRWKFTKSTLSSSISLLHWSRLRYECIIISIMWRLT